jgi:hypothetical protein
MGKNTMVRRALKGFIADGSLPEVERLMPFVRGMSPVNQITFMKSAH